MPGGERFIRVSAQIEDDPRVDKLGSDSARWAWLVTLCKGKWQPTPGTWQSEEHLVTALRRRGKYVPLFLEVGLLERGGHGEVRVRKWEKWQTDPTATKRQRDHREAA